MAILLTEQITNVFLSLSIKSNPSLDSKFDIFRAAKILEKQFSLAVQAYADFCSKNWAERFTPTMQSTEHVPFRFKHRGSDNKEVNRFMRFKRSSADLTVPCVCFGKQIISFSLYQFIHIDNTMVLFLVTVCGNS